MVSLLVELLMADIGNGLKEEFAALVRKYTEDLDEAGEDFQVEALINALAGEMDERAADFWYNSNC